MKKLIGQLIKFGTVGALCFVIDYSLMVFLKEVCGVPVLLSAGISFTVSVIVNYLLSMRFVFVSNNEHSKVAELVIFIILSVIGLGINELIMWLGNITVGEQYYFLAKIVATAVVMVYNFITRKLILEKKHS